MMGLLCSWCALGSRGLLLQLELRAEHGFLDLGLRPAVGGVEERVRRTRLQTRVLGRQVVLRRVVAERHIARQGPDDLEGACELALDLRRYGCGRAIAAGEHDVVAPA